MCRGGRRGLLGSCGALLRNLNLSKKQWGAVKELEARRCSGHL